MLLCAQYVIPVTSEPFENGAILVQGHDIVDYGPVEMLKLRYPDEEVRDFGPAVLMPGFIDLHRRAEDASLRGLVKDQSYVNWLADISHLRKRLYSQERLDSALLGCYEAARGGVTTISDSTITGAVVTAAQEVGLRGVFYRTISAAEKSLVDYTIKKADADLQKWCDQVDSNLISFGIAPDSVYRCHPQLYRAVSDYVNANGDLPVSLHLAGSREEYNFIRYGRVIPGEGFEHKGYLETPPWMPTQVSPVSYVLNWGGFDAKNVTALHAIWVDEEDIETLKRNDVAVAILPSYSAQMGMGMAPLNDFLRAGIRCGLGSGSATMLENDDMFNEMRIELLTQRAANPTEPITAQTLLEMATIRAAEVLRLEDRIGSIEKGKRADIIAVDLSQPRVLPTSDPMTSVMSSAHARNVLFTMVDGKAIYDRKNLEYEKISEMSDRLRATRERFLKNLK